MMAMLPFFFCFQSFNSIHDVVISCVRRSLSYPLYRHWSLVMAVLEDTKRIFTLGMSQGLCLTAKPFLMATPLMQPDFCAPFVTGLTGFHCSSIL